MLILPGPLYPTPGLGLGHLVLYILEDTRHKVRAPKHGVWHRGLAKMTTGH